MSVETSIHDLRKLFRQLGRSGEPRAAAAFVVACRLKAGMASTATPFRGPVLTKFLAGTIADRSARRKPRSIPGYGAASAAGAQS